MALMAILVSSIVTWMHVLYACAVRMCCTHVLSLLGVQANNSKKMNKRTIILNFTVKGNRKYSFLSQGVLLENVIIYANFCKHLGDESQVCESKALFSCSLMPRTDFSCTSD